MLPHLYSSPFELRIALRLTPASSLYLLFSHVHARLPILPCVHLSRVHLSLVHLLLVHLIAHRVHLTCASHLCISHVCISHVCM